MNAVSKVTTALKVLNSGNEFVKAAAKHSLQKNARKKNETVTDVNVLEYLNKGSLRGVSSTFWKDVQLATEELNSKNKHTKLRWVVNDGSFEIELSSAHNYELLNAERMGAAYKIVLDDVKDECLRQLEGRSTTWAYQATSRFACSNFPLQDGSLRLAEYYTVQKARAQALNTRQTQRRFKLGTESANCRWCGSEEESTYHVLNMCQSQFIKTEYLRRHNRICHILVEQARTTNNQQVTINEDVIPALSHDNLRPDIQIIDSVKKTALFIDVAVSVDKYEKLCESERRKLIKYNNLKMAYERRGYSTKVMGFIMGSCGSWHGNNDYVLKELNVQQRNMNWMRSDIVTATMKGTHEVWKCFASGQRQGYLKRNWNHRGREYDNLFHIESLTRSTITSQSS